MSKTKHIKALKEIAKLEAYLKKERQRITNYLILTSMNRKKREIAYENRKLIKAGNRESCRQRKIRLNRERRQALKTA